MNNDFSVHDMMVAFSTDAVEQAKELGVELDFSEESMKQLETILERYHASLPRGIKKLFRKGPTEEQIHQVSMMWGAYLGEVMRKHLGGEWGMSKHFDNAIAFFWKDSEVYPPAKVSKRIVGGDGDNVWVFYQVLKNDSMRVHKL